MKIFKAIGAGIGITVSFFYLGCGSIQVAEASHGTSASPLTIATRQLPSAIIGKPYVAVLDATGGTPSYEWSVAGGELPSGVSLAPSTGILSGTPTTSGNFSISLAVADSGNPSQSKSSTVTIRVAAAPLKIAVSAITSASVGNPYSQALQASGGTAPYAWSITSGTLPAGLSLASSTGTISGAPTTNGTAKFVATVHDGGHPAQTESVLMSIVVAAAPLKLTTLALSSATSGIAYSQALQASGGTQAYTWSMASGNLPTGLSLSSTGMISGTPTNSGVASFTVNLSDHSSPVQIISQPFILTVGSTPLTIATPVLPSVTVGKPYSQILKASGGTAPYFWSIKSGSLPSGLTLATSTGLISGVPTASGTSTFTAMVLDGGNPAQSLSVAIRIAVAPIPLTIVASTLPSVLFNQPYLQTLRATGGAPPYTWSITSGSLPTGLTLAAATGTISGTATTAGISSFTVAVTDSSNPAQTASAIKSVMINSTPLAVVTPVLPPVTVGSPYSKALAATGGVGPYVWSITSGRLPQGLSLAASAGTISGVPTASGVSSFTATVTDSGSPTQSAPAQAAIVVAPTLLAITSSTLAASTIGASYSQSLQAAGGSAPYTWTVTTGTLPAGLSLSPSAGMITGTPTVSGKFTFTTTVADSSSPAQQTSATSAISITPTLAKPTTIAPLALSITTGSLPSSTVGSSYAQTLQATGGTGAYTWSIASGQLPAGLSLSSSGTISGVPTAGGSSFTVSLADSGTPAQSQSATYSIAVTASATPLTIASSVLASGTTGTFYSQGIQASGGTPAYTWAITSGSLPAGLTLAATTGMISGTPTVTAVSNFTATVSDNGNPIQTQSVAVSITVAAPMPSGPGTTWYIRTDGGTRYSGNVLTGQCDGQADVAYPGTGTNQHCAFNDIRYMWNDNSGYPSAWVISGGDTVLIRGCSALGTQRNPDNPHCRIGYDNPTSGGGANSWCGYGIPNTECYNPPIPAGTSGNPTRILGQNYANCTSKTQLFGGFGASTVLNLSNTRYVTLACLEITDHSDCIKHGVAGLPSVCSNNVPYTDYANNGIITTQTTANIVLQDISIHGMPHGGLAGAIGGAITMTRVSSNYNGFAGWDFDWTPSGVGMKPNNPIASINASYVTMNWNGCNEEYPIVDPIPVTYCYSILNNGFGDAWSGQDSDLASMTCDHCEMAYNVKDAFFGPHTAIGSVIITNSVARNNGGQTWKANLGSSGTWLMKNTLTNNNCRRLYEPIVGAPSTFNTYISSADMCRADGATIAVVWPAAGSFELDNNTFVTASQNVGFDFTCWNTFSSVSVGSGGTGYTVGDILYPGGTQATVTVTSVGAGGVITGISLTTGGQVTNSSVPFGESYVFGGTGSGAVVTVNTVTPVNCGGGPRIMRNNVFLGFTNPDNVSWNGQLINALCYSSCNGNPGMSTDAMWTTRTANVFYGWGAGLSSCSYAGEYCYDPLLLNEPARMSPSAESALDVFNPFVSGNSFHPTSSSPLRGAGTPINGTTTDFYDIARPSPPTVGAVEP